MKETLIVRQLLTEVIQKGLSSPLRLLKSGEAETLSVYISEETGQRISGKSIREFVKNVLSQGERGSKPSLASLDILARYILEIDKDSVDDVSLVNYQSWFDYKKRIVVPSQNTSNLDVHKSRKKRRVYFYFLLAIPLILIFAFWGNDLTINSKEIFEENFNDLSDAELAKRGWFLQDPDPYYWNQRNLNNQSNDTSRYLTLFTLRGDNWVANEKPYIKNRLIRPINVEHKYEIEFDIKDFFPNQNFQQCGFMLMDDTLFDKDLLRVCITTSRYPRSRGEYFSLQALVFDNGTTSRPTEYSKPFFSLTYPNEAYDQMICHYSYMSIKLVCENKKIRILASYGENKAKSYSDRTKEFSIDFTPKYISLYASGPQITHPQPDTIPVMIDRVSIKSY
ncbi:MAG: hypothetical protein KDD99_08640 [Bacteroidetes bacterium]|nr:hypothetical protein [Bacteroidota bacterium]